MSKYVIFGCIVGLVFMYLGGVFISLDWGWITLGTAHGRSAFLAVAVGAGTIGAMLGVFAKLVWQPYGWRPYGKK